MVVGRGRTYFRDIGLAIAGNETMLTLTGEFAQEKLCQHF
jgi:hypothetical protein